MTTLDLLNQLAELRAAKEITRLDYQDKRERILDAVREQLNDLDTEFAPLTTLADERSAELEQLVKESVIAGGESVKGEFLHAVYVKGRTTWETKLLDGFAAAHPEILQFRKVGEPSVTIRSSK